MRVWILPKPYKSVFCECCVFSGKGFCNGPILRPEESYRLWCVTVCDLETSRMRRPWQALGCCAREKKVEEDSGIINEMEQRSSAETGSDSACQGIFILPLNPNFNVVFTRTHHWTLLCITWIQSLTVSFCKALFNSVGPNSVVGIATHYGLNGPGIEFRAGARFSATLQTCSASCTMDNGSLSRGQSGRGMALTTHLHLAPRLKKEHSYTSTPPLGLNGLL
jgi:hypothetical protein